MNKTNKDIQTAEKSWGWLCEGIKDPEIRRNTILVLENSAQNMIELNLTTEDAIKEIFSEEYLTEVESGNPNASGYSGANGTVGNASRNGVQNYVVPKVMFPVIRRVMPQLIANQIVSVQPINGRTGVVFYASYQFANAKGGVDVGDQFTGNYTIDDLGDVTDLRAEGGQAILGQAFYSSQKCGPFTPTVTYTVTRSGTDTELDPYVYAAASVDEVDVDTKLHLFFKTNPRELLALEAFPTASGPASEYTFATTEAEGTYTYNATTGAVTYYLATALAHKKTGTELGDIYNAVGNTAHTFTVPVDAQVFVNYNQESSVNIPEMMFTLDSTSINTKERKLKVRYTQEAAQDLKNHQQLDLESELVKMASTDMNYEIDREVIDFVDRVVPAQLKWTHNWNFNGDGAGATVYNFLDRHRALSQSIYSLAGRMAQFNRQGAANWAVVSPKIAAILQMLPEFSKEDVSLSPNIYTIGSLNKIKYYVDPNRVGTNEDVILMGFKSPITSYGTGVVYSPYASWMTATIIDPNNFDSNKGFFSRYAITLLPRGQWFYGKLLITGLNKAPGMSA